jgi:hypothetical protein
MYIHNIIIMQFEVDEQFEFLSIIDFPPDMKTIFMYIVLLYCTVHQTVETAHGCYST